jgi:hypothetical protein
VGKLLTLQLNITLTWKTLILTEHQWQRNQCFMTLTAGVEEQLPSLLAIDFLSNFMIINKLLLSSMGKGTELDLKYIIKVFPFRMLRLRPVVKFNS